MLFQREWNRQKFVELSGLLSTRMNCTNMSPSFMEQKQRQSNQGLHYTKSILNVRPHMYPWII